MSRLKSFFPILIITASVLFAYSGLQNSFFEQDEWHSFGYYNHLLTLNGDQLFKTILSNGPLSHFTPLSLFFKMSLYQLFGLNAAAYFNISIFLHILVSLGVYFLALLLTRKKLPSLIGALFFSVNSSHYQAITWLGTFEGAELATFFGIISIINLVYYLNTKKQKMLYMAFFLLFFSLLFKETAVAFLFLMVGLVVVKLKGNIRRNALLSLGGISCFYILLRSSYLLFGVRTETIYGQGSGNVLLMSVYNVLTLPVKIFSQILLPNELIVNVTNKATTPFNLYQIFGKGPWVLENGLRYDFLMIPIGLIIFLVLLFVGRKSGSKLSFFIGLFLILFTLVPFLIMKKYLTYFDSRYLYSATVGFSLILSSILAARYSFRLLLIPAILVISFTHIITLRETVATHASLGSIRKMILTTIHYENPRLPEKVVFYTESDTPYYGLSDQERILPFQSGLGQTLLVYYQGRENYHDKFFKDFFLWEIGDQGYREEGGRGFGYFRDFDLLNQVIKQYNVPTDSVIAYSWDSKTNTLTNTTDEVKARLNNAKD